MASMFAGLTYICGVLSIALNQNELETKKEKYNRYDEIISNWIANQNRQILPIKYKKGEL